MEEYNKALQKILGLIKRDNVAEKEVLLSCGINTSFFSDWKNGRLKKPSADKIKKIANYFGVSADYILEDDIRNVIDNVCKEKGFTGIKQALKDAKISPSLISDIMNGTREIADSEVQSLSELLSVSVDYLLGKEPPQPETSLDGIEFALFGEVKDLTEAQKKDVLNFAKYIKSQNKKD